MQNELRVLFITSEWPTAEHPEWVPFLVHQVKSLRESGISVDVFFFRGAKRCWNYWRARQKVQKKLSQKTYDLIHAQFGQSGLLVIPQSIPLVVTFHGSDVLGIVGDNGRYTFAGELLKNASKIVASIADETIVVARQLVSYLPKRKYHVLPMGIDLNLFSPIPQSEARRALGISNQATIVLFGANHLNKIKRFWLAKKAFERVRSDFSDISMIALERIDHDQVPLYLNACDVLLLTSLHEGSPTVVKEALACNLPVVSTDVGDVRALIGSIEGCVVCQDDRPGTIAAALAQVLSRRQRINGRMAALELDEHLLARKVIQIYRQAIEKFSKKPQRNSILSRKKV